jgi:ribosome maturation factor RimP
VAGVASDLRALIERTVEGLGYELVDAERAGGGLLRITLDLPAATRAVTIEDCERVSHHLVHLLAAENVAYERLEVGSPGVDRPLRKVADFVRFAGAEVKVELNAPVDGRRRLRGRLVEVSGAPGAERVAIDLADEGAAAPARARPTKTAKPKPTAALRRVVFALADVDKARLVPELDFRSRRS